MQYIGILPYEMRKVKDLANVSVASLYWKGGNQPKGNRIADLDEQVHIVVSPSSNRVLRGWSDVSCHIDLMISEPKAIHKKYYYLIWLLRHKFSLILMRYPEYAKRYSNVILLNTAYTFVDPVFEKKVIPLPQNKEKLCSLIASNKRKLIGHRLRHSIVDHIAHNQIRAIDVMGRGYQPFNEKWEGLLPYRYSIVIENVQEENYFTEKLLDCFMCNTIPIYWGAPNIGNYFDVSGMLVCNDEKEIVAALNKIISEEPSQLLLEKFQENRAKVFNYLDLPKRIVTAVADHLNQSNVV